jgi:hypothetical protein
MTEREQVHRQGLESQVVAGDLRLKGRGQMFAAFALVVSLVVVCVFVFLAHPVEGATLGGAIIIGVVALFLGQRWSPGANQGGADA